MVFGVLLILLIQGIRGLIMRLMVGMVGVAAIIIEGNGLGHTCLGTRCRLFCPVIPFHHDGCNGIGS